MAKEVNIIVRGIRRKEPDLERLARALLKQAQDEHPADGGPEMGFPDSEAAS